MFEYFNVDSVKIACWINRRSFEEKNPCLFFIHGSGGDHSLWSFQYAGLSKGFNIIAVELPGHGRSEGDGEDDINKYALWVKKLLSIMKLKNVVIVGHSLGAAIALHFASNFEEMIKGVVAVGGGLKMPVNPTIFELLKTMPETAFDLICKFSLAKDNRSILSETLKKSLTETKIEILYKDLAACDKMDLTDQVGKIKLPSLIICGKEDKMTPPELSRHIASSIGGSKICLIEGAGHMVMMERPEDFNNALIMFAQTIFR